MDILVIALSINPRPLSALELKLSGLIMESRVDTAGDNRNAHVIISNELILVHEIYMLCSNKLLQVNKALDNEVYLVIIKGKFHLFFIITYVVSSW